MKTAYFLILFTLHFSLSTSSTAQVGNPAPDFTITDVHGKKHRLYEYLDQGKKVVLDFFFTTCIPCQFYAPQVNKAYEKYGCNTQDVIFLSIDYNDTDAEVIEYENDYQTKFPSASGLEGGGNAVVSQYKIIAFPTLILIDSTKKIVDEIDPPTLIVFDHKFNLHGITPKECLTKTENQLHDKSFFVYPNPSMDGRLNITSNSSFDNTDFELLDYSGKVIRHFTNHTNGTNTFNFDVNEVPVGIYLLKIIENGQATGFSKISILR
jgi:thiol-disulfide isomerase/thioredoxin